jgi:Leucine-rich repeat (LRR) protein
MNNEREDIDSINQFFNEKFKNDYYIRGILKQIPTNPKEHITREEICNSIFSKEWIRNKLKAKGIEYEIIDQEISRLLENQIVKTLNPNYFNYLINKSINLNILERSKKGYYNITPFINNKHIGVSGKNLLYLIKNDKALTHFHDLTISRNNQEDNYDKIMTIKVKEPQYFRKLNPSSNSILGSIYHIDIEKETVLKIDKLHNDLISKLFDENEWVILSGRSGLSKTTTAKILAYYAKTQKKMHVKFENNAINIKKFIEKIEESKEEWLLIVDDLHREDYGSIHEKLLELVRFNRRKELLHVLITSRSTLDDINQLCNDSDEALEVVTDLIEINLREYADELKNIKHTLIKKFLKNEFNEKQIKKAEVNIMQNFSEDFIILGFALKTILVNNSININRNQILRGIQNLISTELKKVANSNNIKYKIILTIYIGVNYLSMGDISVSADDFVNDIKLFDCTVNIEKVLDVLASNGLLIKTNQWFLDDYNFDSKNALYHNHAKIADWHLRALRIDSKEWSELCLLSKFKSYNPENLNLEDIFSNFKKLTHLSLHLSLSDLPESIGNLKSLQKLDLRFNKLSKLPSSIKNLKNLKVLDLSNNNLTEFPELIRALTSITELDLSGNRIQRVPRLLGDLHSLEILELSKNKIISLPNSMGDLKPLKRLILRRNSLEILPASIGKLKNLKILDLSANNLKNLPQSIGKLKSLKQLDLSFNKLESLPNSLGNITLLQYLCLERNKLNSIPELIGTLRSLKYLNLGSNDYSDLPESLGDLKSLQHLVVGSVQLKNLPFSFNSLKLLKVLFAFNCNFKIFPEIITRLNSLQELYLINCKIKYLPESIGNLLSLRKVHLDDNYLTSLPKSLEKISLLQDIYLTGNEFSNFPKVVVHLKSLKRLDLSFNALKDIPDSIGNLKLLEYLNLSNNRIIRIPDTIGNINSLKRLFLNSNDLEKLPETIKNLKSLDLIIRLNASNIDSKTNNEFLTSLITIKNYLRQFPHKYYKFIVENPHFIKKLKKIFLPI